MPQTRTRVVGSGFTTFNYRGRPIAFLDGFADSGESGGAEPMAGGGGGGGRWQFIHPLGAKHPREIATARYLTGGTLVLTIRELWNAQVWQQLAGLASARNLLDVWEALAADPAEVTCQMIITPPPGAGRRRGKTYHNCVVVGVDDSEAVTIGALTIARNLSVAYTHSTGL